MFKLIYCVPVNRLKYLKVYSNGTRWWGEHDYARPIKGGTALSHPLSTCSPHKYFTLLFDGLEVVSFRLPTGGV